MDNLHTVLRSIRGEVKSAPNHMSVFREFLAQLEQIQRKQDKPKSAPRISRAKATRRKPSKRK